MAETQETKLVRLKPYNPKRGHNLRRYGYGGVIFDGERGWYRVNAALAEELKYLRQDHDDEDSPLAFDVCTDAEAAAIDEKEADAATVRKTAAKSNVITDLSTKPAPAGEAVPTSDDRRGQRRGG